MIVRQSRRVAAAIAVAGITLAACSGLPDQGFGTDGITAAPFAGQWQAAVTLTGGKYLAAASDQFGSGKVFRFNADGTVDATYADHGAVSTLCGGYTMAPDGRFFCFNDNADDVVTAFTSTGAADTAFNGGSIHVPFETGSFGSAVSSTGDLYLLFSTNITSPTPTLSLRRYDTAGQQDPDFVADMGPDNTAYVAGFGPAAASLPFTATFSVTT